MKIINITPETIKGNNENQGSLDNYMILLFNIYYIGDNLPFTTLATIYPKKRNNIANKLELNVF